VEFSLPKLETEREVLPSVRKKYLTGLVDRDA